MIAFAAMLLFAAAVNWIVVAGMATVARAYARFAFVLYAALAIAIAVDARLAVFIALIVSAIAPMMLALALAGVVRGWVSTVFASVALAAASIAGMAAAFTGFAALAFVPLLFAVVAMIAVMLSAWRDGPMASIQIAASAVALLAGASAFVAGGAASQPAFCAFTAAGLLGVATSLAQGSNVSIEDKRTRNLSARNAIRGTR